MLDLMQQLLEAAGTADEPRTQGGGTMPILQKTADKRAAELDKAAAVLKEYQEHTAAANALIIEIAKGIKAGEDIHILFLKALEALELITNNKMIEQTAADFAAIYGAGLHTDSLLKIELEQAKARLEKLEQAAADATTDSGQRERIRAAIAAHKEKIKHLQQQIE